MFFFFVFFFISVHYIYIHVTIYTFKPGHTIHARIQEFLSGGRGPGQSDKKCSDNVFIFFLALSLFYRSQMVNFKEIYHFQGSGGGPTFSRAGPTFSRRGPIAYSL